MFSKNNFYQALREGPPGKSERQGRVRLHDFLCGSGCRWGILFAIWNKNLIKCFVKILFS